jgi:hypothetical protein
MNPLASPHSGVHHGDESQTSVFVEGREREDWHAEEEEEQGDEAKEGDSNQEEVGIKESRNSSAFDFGKLNRHGIVTAPQCELPVSST